MADENILDDLREQVTRITLDEPCSPAELKLANALCVLISLVKEDQKQIGELHSRTIGQMRFG